jgi:hypothetical protein
MCAMRLVFVIAIGFATALDASAASIYRCATATGIAYQEFPCDAGARESALPAADFPPVNATERTRLLDREAALDARMLKRAEIDASERIAREARWAREAELEAERERARAAAAQYYPIYPIYGRPAYARPVYRPGQSALIRY